MKKRVGILYPGAMGISVAASAQKGGCEVYWASEKRSSQTCERAEKHNLLDARSLAQISQICDVVISVCPPHAAEDVASQVLDHGFQGLYLDANAISPMRVARIGQKMTASGVTFVDGGIVGGPAWEPGRTWLYLSGPGAETVAECFSAGPLETHIMGEEIGKASALKMCFAAYTKGTTALLCGTLATAETLGVRKELENQWATYWPDFDEQSRERVRRVTAKAWRFAGEMKEISATFEHAGLPGGFHAAAEDIYRRIAGFKDATATPSLTEVLSALARSDGAKDS